LSESFNPVLKVENLIVNRSGKNILDNIFFSIEKNENLAIVGRSGSGKTTLGLALAQKLFYRGTVAYTSDIKNIEWVEQQHHFKNLQNTSELYYQQRFNSYDSEETLTVAESLDNMNERADALFKEMGIGYLKNEKLIHLSNGENKKLQLLKAQLTNPSVIILDQPFIGLDVQARNYLEKQLEKLIRKGILIILITSPNEIPECINKVLDLKDGKVNSFTDREMFTRNYKPTEKVAIKIAPEIFKSKALTRFDSIVEMKNVTVEYGDKKILDDINWKVIEGERWLLTGPNGAGKSTLLSLITADNPKAYANEIYLFGKRRGTGESIWDIKKKIGFLSPELHVFFNQFSTCFETVASGLYDTIGLFRQLSDEDIETVNRWMQICNINKLSDKRLHELSLGEQRVVLLTRAMVKDPPLFILDEPCQGVDDERKSELINLINEICIAGNKTLIYVSHYENERPACISHFLKLEKGKAVSIK
jgi:molybdate transport system ATP-binding protein